MEWKENSRIVKGIEWKENEWIEGIGMKEE